MKTTKSIHELLILLKKQYTQDVKEKTNSGLCQSINQLAWLSTKNSYLYDNLPKGLSAIKPIANINLKERNLLNSYLYDNRPKYRKGSKYISCIINSAYFWNPIYIKPRLKWLNYHIKKTQGHE